MEVARHLCNATIFRVLTAEHVNSARTASLNTRMLCVKANTHMVHLGKTPIVIAFNFPCSLS